MRLCCCDKEENVDPAGQFWEGSREREIIFRIFPGGQSPKVIKENQSKRCCYSGQSDWKAGNACHSEHRAGHRVKDGGHHQTSELLGHRGPMTGPRPHSETHLCLCSMQLTFCYSGRGSHLGLDPRLVLIRWGDLRQPFCVSNCWVPLPLKAQC